MVSTLLWLTQDYIFPHQIVFNVDACFYHHVVNFMRIENCLNSCRGEKQFVCYASGSYTKGEQVCLL